MLLINRYRNRLDEFLITVIINKKDRKLSFINLTSIILFKRNFILESFIVESTDDY
jgi:hypothetical protein